MMFSYRNVSSICSIIRFRYKFYNTTQVQRKYSWSSISSKRDLISIKNLIIAGICGGILYDSCNEFQYLGGLKRFLRSAKIAILISFDYKWNLYNLEEGTDVYKEAIDKVHQRSAERLLAGCLANGGLYIKIGQGVAAINHILPIQYIDTLKLLENECLPRKKDEVKSVFLKDFGKLPEDIFQTFDYTPIAAASLAQVFRATTKDGKQVAVKVQYIDLQRRFSGDLGTILFLQSAIALVHKDYNFNWILIDLRNNLEKELDFTQEGRNSERCARDLAKFKFVHIPRVYWDLTCARILTAEWIDGYKISNVNQIKADGFDFADVDRKLFNIFAEQIFSSGFVHADPHPGNVFLRKNKKGQPEIVLLDHGLYETLSEKTRLSICKFWEAVVLRDLKRMEKYGTELNVKDYVNLAEILLQRPFNIPGRPRISARLTEEEIKYFVDRARNQADLILSTLKELPRTMLFILRCLNTIRAIARNHGDPINRLRFMAVYAQKCIYKNDKRWLSKLTKLYRRIRFEIYMFRSNLMFWFTKKYLEILAALNKKLDLSIVKELENRIVV